MIGNTSRWSHAAVNQVVACLWQATPPKLPSL